MANGDLIELDIERITSEGAGIGRCGGPDGGKAVFVDCAAPGDRVLARVFEEKRGYARARLDKVVAPSHSRVAAPCPYFGECGGCALQHLEYGAQLVQKRLLLADAFARIGGIPSLPAMLSFSGVPYGYRNRMQFHRAKKNAGVGLMRRSGKDVLTVGDCPIAEEGIRHALRSSALSVPPWLDRMRVFSRAGVFLSEGGAERGEIHAAGKKLKIDVAGFFQSNVDLLEILLSELLERARESADAGPGRALDLYCGVGTFAAFLVDFFPDIDMVELDKKAAALARENVKGSGTRLFALSDDDWAKRKEGAAEPYAFAVVDPPRVGLSPALRRWLAANPPRTLAYVSCDPATLARDAKELAAAGLELSALSLYDFYPQTPHIESLALFRSGR